MKLEEIKILNYHFILSKEEFDAIMGELNNLITDTLPALRQLKTEMQEL